ncbi:hypothetical protein V1511DRAFT_513264 [Dipodascopsis uninucleata]
MADLLNNDELALLKAKELDTFLGVSLIVSITDGRQFYGILMGSDNECNLILDEATERLPIDFKSRRTTMRNGFRYVGKIVVPGQYIVRIEAEKQQLQHKLRATVRENQPFLSLSLDAMSSLGGII